MPKGEHFKKENPRNYQVSFKVNKTELDQLRKLTQESGLSIPEWLRSHIILDESVKPKPVKKTAKKSNKDLGKNSEDQTSLF
ncbi:MAG: hypothetical protein OEW67_04750 [Cyclobacteriaceae bacterium]|nr:hypothetical protein [Cyclobacteriaceae bacterium]